MPNNKLILRSVNSPWVSPFNDITTGSVLSWADVDNNFIYLKGELIHSGYTNNNQLILQKINGNSLSISGFTNDNFFTTGGTYNPINESIDFIGNSSETTFSIDVSELLTGRVIGKNYIFVAAKGTDIENALELKSAYDLAKTMSPSETKRITIIAAPGNYNPTNLSATPPTFPNFVMDTPFIDLVSLDGNRSIIFNGIATISITANNVFVKGVDVVTKNFTITKNLNLKIENCKGGDNSFGGSDLITVSAEFINCQGGNLSFGGGGVASGVFSNCIGGNSSFGGGGVASGTFTHCIGDEDSFGGNGGTLTGKLYYCRLTSSEFEKVSGGGRVYYSIDGNGVPNNQ
jgi:hypothetical protein